MPGGRLRLRETSRMHDEALVIIALVIGGVAYLAVFFWVTVTRVRELGPPKPPPEHH